MSKIQRYHTNEYGDLVKSNASYAKICKYEDVKHLERQLAEAREELGKEIKKAQAFEDAYKHFDRLACYWKSQYEQLKEKNDEQ